MTTLTHLSNLTTPDIHTVDIWQIYIDIPAASIQSLKNTLDTQELERYQRLHKKHQQSFLVSHIACRQILAQYLNLSAKQINYKKNKYGKPQLDHDTTICFNMSHSHNYAIIAISNHADVGVDIEFIKEKPSWEKIARRFFHPNEIAYLLDQDTNKQKTTFFQIWTRKEAYIKALGTGFATPFSSFDVITKDEIIDSDTNPDTNNWYQKDLKIIPQYTAAIAQNTLIKKIRYYSY